MSEEKKAINTYYNPKQGFLSLQKLWKRINEQGIHISFNDLSKILQKQETYHIHNQIKPPAEYAPITSDRPFRKTQGDIMIYERHKHNYKYVLGVIDVYSRYCACRPLTNMRIPTILSAFKDIFEEFGRVCVPSYKIKYPENINMDNQFNVPQIVDDFTEHGTHIWFSQPEQIHKNSVIERFWGTLAKLLERMREGIKNFDWVKALPEAMENCNSTFHTSIQATPLYILNGKSQNPIERKEISTDLNQGDRVRIRHKKTIYDKGHSVGIYT